MKGQGRNSGRIAPCCVGQGRGTRRRRVGGGGGGGGWVAAGRRVCRRRRTRPRGRRSSASLWCVLVWWWASLAFLVLCCLAFPGFALEFTIVHRVLLWPLSSLWFAAAEAERSVLCARFLAGLVASSFAGWPVARVVVSGMSPVTRPWSVRLDSSALSSSRLRCHLVFIITCVMLFCYFSDVSLASARLSWASSWASSVLVLMSGCTAVAVAAPSACIVSAVWPLCYCGGLWRACRAQVHARIFSFWDAACVRGVPWMRVSHLVIQDWFMCIFVDLMCCLCLLGVPCRHAAAVRRPF